MRPYSTPEQRRRERAANQEIKDLCDNDQATAIRILRLIAAGQTPCRALRQVRKTDAFMRSGDLKDLGV